MFSHRGRKLILQSPLSTFTILFLGAPPHPPIHPPHQPAPTAPIRYATSRLWGAPGDFFSHYFWCSVAKWYLLTSTTICCSSISSFSSLLSPHPLPFYYSYHILTHFVFPYFSSSLTLLFSFSQSAFFLYSESVPVSKVMCNRPKIKVISLMFLNAMQINFCNHHLTNYANTNWHLPMTNNNISLLIVLCWIDKVKKENNQHVIELLFIAFVIENGVCHGILYHVETVWHSRVKFG